MKEIIFDKKNYKSYDEFFIDICNKIDPSIKINISTRYNANSTYFISRLLFKNIKEEFIFTFKNFDLAFIKHNTNKSNYDFADTLRFFEYYSKRSSNVKVKFCDDSPTPFIPKPIKKEIIFNKKDYKDYKELYHDICIKLDKDRFIDWRDDYEDLGYDANILNEFLWYCHKDNIKYIFVNFDKEKIKQHKNFDDYKYNLVIEVFESFVAEYPNNQIEFRFDYNS